MTGPLEGAGRPDEPPTPDQRPVGPPRFEDAIAAEGMRRAGAEGFALALVNAPASRAGILAALDSGPAFARRNPDGRLLARVDPGRGALVVVAPGEPDLVFPLRRVPSRPPADPMATLRDFATALRDDPATWARMEAARAGGRRFEEPSADGRLVASLTPDRARLVVQGPDGLVLTVRLPPPVRRLDGPG